MSATLEALQTLLVEELELPGKKPSDLDPDVPVFGEGLGLDSLDALQIAMSIEERFGVRVPEGKEARPIFQSLRTLAAYVDQHKPS